jgi:hypothetical protein
MSAPTPWSATLPILFTQSFQKRQFGVGNLNIGSYSSAPVSFPANATIPYWPNQTAGLGTSGGYTPGISGFTYGGTVFDNLVTQPGTGAGATAETASTAAAQAVGTTITTGYNTYLNSTTANAYTPAVVQNLAHKNYDAILNFYLEASILRSGGSPVA